MERNAENSIYRIVEQNNNPSDIKIKLEKVTTEKNANPETSTQCDDESVAGTTHAANEGLGAVTAKGQSKSRLPNENSRAGVPVGTKAKILKARQAKKNKVDSKAGLRITTFTSVGNVVQSAEPIWVVPEQSGQSGDIVVDLDSMVLGNGDIVTLGPVEAIDFLPPADSSQEGPHNFCCPICNNWFTTDLTLRVHLHVDHKQ